MVLFEDRLLLTTSQLIVDINIKYHLDKLSEESCPQVNDYYIFRNIHIIQLESHYKFINFVDIGSNKEAMLLEHRVTRQLRFFSPCLDGK